MKTPNLNFMVKKRNGPGCPSYKIPIAVAELMETDLKCSTAGKNKKGLRWENNGIGVVFFEHIMDSGMHIYILPTTNKQKWRTDKQLRRILNKNNFSDLSNRIRTARDGKDLRIRCVSWERSLKVLPVLAEWSYSSQTRKSLKSINGAKSPRLPNTVGKTGKCKMPDGTTKYEENIDERSRMAKYKTVYQSRETISARERGSGEWIEYDAAITIKDGGKNPVCIEMTLDSIPPFAIELPKTHTIRVKNLTQAYAKVVRFLKRYGFEFK